MQHCPGHGALAATGGTHQGEALTGVEVEGQASQGVGACSRVAHHQLIELQHRAGGLAGGHGGRGGAGGDQVGSRFACRPAHGAGLFQLLHTMG